MRDSFDEILEQLRGFGDVHAPAFDLRGQAEEEATMLAERLPLGAPTDVLLVTSPPLLREVARKLVDVFDHTPEEAAQKRFSLATWTTFPVEDFNEALLDRLAPDRDDDFLIHTAFEGRADFIVTDEPGLLVDGEGTEYKRLDGLTAAAYSFEGFAETIETSAFSLSQVPELLSVRVSDVKPPLVEDF